MVTKQIGETYEELESSVLAKIHMVTKLCQSKNVIVSCSVLAKIHMVTKLKPS